MGFRSKPKKLTADQLWEYALKVLGQRAHSASEVKQKLSRRAENPAEVAPTMAKLREYGLTDDKKYSEALANSRLQNQGLGSFRVLRELRAKRVGEGIAAEAIQKVYSGTEEPQLIDAFLQRKYRNQDLPKFLQDQKNLASAYRRLRTAGFSSSGSLTVLRRYSNAAEDWEEPPEE